MSQIEEVLKDKELKEMLEFETQIFLDIIHKDGLVVAAKGINLDVIIVNILKVYCDPGNLVFVLNCTECEEKYFKEKLDDENVHIVNSTMSASEKEDVYLSGGIHFVKTRILVVDMLKNRVPIDKITGIVLLRAHAVFESCQEAFVLRMYRQKNKIGFVKAFSNSVQSFTIGFGHIERIMRALFVKELYIWPRFHSLIIQSLKEHQPQVIELHIPISNTMSKIQTCILDLINLTIKELKTGNKMVEMQEITMENCLTKQFHKILQHQLDCVWHQLNSRSHQLIADLRTLRHLIIKLFYDDPVSFYATICGYRKMEYAQQCAWVFFEPAEILFTYANSLVFNEDQELNPEFCPKWKSLSEILKVEIPYEIKNSNINHNKVLILCQDNRTCYQLNHYLTHGPRHYLFQMALKHGVKFKSINKKFENFQDLPEFSQSLKQTFNSSINMPKKAKVEPEKTENVLENELEDMKDIYCLTMSQCFPSDLDESEQDDSGYFFEPFTEMENMNLTQLCNSTETNSDLMVLIQTFKNNDSFLELQRNLEEFRPNFIIMYHSNMTAIRNIEMYEAHRVKDTPLKIYFLIHTETVEEQSYLTTLRKEKEAFEFLIQTKSTMVIAEDQDGKTDDCVALQREITLPEFNSRHGGLPLTETPKNIIIVDMREFQSELPALIHRRGIEIEPVFISIGDYILTPEICVERKTVSDLIGSLRSGRLYQQCIRMSRYYTKPMLLIEFNQNKSFFWQDQCTISKDSDSFEAQQRLLLLTLHFPKLKIVWSGSPYASAQLFEELKAGKEQPNVNYASAPDNEQDLDVIETKYNTGIYDFIQKLPGINSKNINQFLKKCKSLDDVIKMSETELKDVLGNLKDAKTFYSILHDEHTSKDSSTKGRFKGKVREKFKHIKK